MPSSPRFSCSDACVLAGAEYMYHAHLQSQDDASDLSSFVVQPSKKAQPSKLNPNAKSQPTPKPTKAPAHASAQAQSILS
jgi:hypothetical protein